MKMTRLEKKEKAIKKFGGMCAICRVECGADKNSVFHHLDYTTKKGNMAHLWGCSQKKIDKELGKCVLMCKTCHDKMHKECGKKMRLGHSLTYITSHKE